MLRNRNFTTTWRTHLRHHLRTLHSVFRPQRSVTFTISGDLVTTLENLACEGNTTTTEELKKAIQDRFYFSNKTAEGHKVILERGNKRIHVILT